MNSPLILLIISILPVIILGYYVYSKDRNKEPKKLLISLFIGGIASIFIVIYLSSLLGVLFPILDAEPEKLNLLELIINVFIGVALIEEICKFFIIYKMAYNDKAFDEFYDMIVYGTFVGLGFACLENIVYVLENGFIVGISRAILAVPGHAALGVLMGYYLGLAKINELNNRKDHKKKNILLSILIPVIFHGIDDYCIFAFSNTGSMIFFIAYLFSVLIVYILAFDKVNRISKISRKMKYQENYCPICGRRIDSNYCPICGRENK